MSYYGIIVKDKIISSPWLRGPSNQLVRCMVSGSLQAKVWVWSEFWCEYCRLMWKWKVITQCLLVDFRICCNWSKPILCTVTDEIGKNVGHAYVFFQCRRFGRVLIM